jgi:fucose permease
MTIDANLLEGLKIGFAIGIVAGFVLAIVGARLAYRAAWDEIRRKKRGAQT